MRFIAAFSLLLALSAPASAQFSVELRGGGAVGNHQPAAAGLETGIAPAFSAAAEVRVHSLVSLYAGYSRASFGCEEGFCTDRDVTFTSSGIGSGLRLDPSGLPWLRTGLVYHGLEVQSADGTEDWDPGIGYEIGSGLSFSPGRRIHLLPGVSYRRHLATADGVEATTSLLIAEIGVRISLGGSER